VTDEEAWNLLEGKELVRAMRGAMQGVRDLAAKCLDADIPVVLERCPGKT